MIKLELSEQMIAIIGQALGRMPYEVVALTVLEVQKQINQQKNHEKLYTPQENGKAAQELGA